MKKKEEKKKEEAVDPDAAAPYPNMDLAQRIHRLTVARNDQLENEVFQEIAVELENPSLYKVVHDKLYGNVQPLMSATKLTADDLHELEEKNKETVATLEAAVEEAIESAGDMEVMDARVALARFAAKSLSEKDAIAYYEKLLELPKVSSGKKIDSLMASARVASFYGDTATADDYMERAHKLAEAGGGADWDRRNRLKVYRSLQYLLHRDMAKAAGLLLDCIATFSCKEICSYQEFIVYVILTNMLHLPRPELKKKIIDGPEILSVSNDIPAVVRIDMKCLNVMSTML